MINILNFIALSNALFSLFTLAFSIYFIVNTFDKLSSDTDNDDVCNVFKNNSLAVIFSISLINIAYTAHAIIEAVNLSVIINRYRGNENFIFNLTNHMNIIKKYYFLAVTNFSFLVSEITLSNVLLYKYHNEQNNCFFITIMYVYIAIMLVNLTISFTIFIKYLCCIRQFNNFRNNYPTDHTTNFISQLSSETESEIDYVRDESREECSICCDDKYKKWKKLNCNHDFHEKCINRWLRNQTNCPVCRSENI